MEMQTIKVKKSTNRKSKPSGELDFGTIFTDHMFMMDYTKGKVGMIRN